MLLILLFNGTLLRFCNLRWFRNLEREISIQRRLIFFFLAWITETQRRSSRKKRKKKVHLPINSNASWKYCLMFWCGVSLAGICLYLTPGLFCVVGGWQVTLRTQLAPTVDGSIASRPLPSRRCGKTGDAGCVSISVDKGKGKIFY